MNLSIVICILIVISYCIIVKNMGKDFLICILIATIMISLLSYSNGNIDGGKLNISDYFITI